MVNLAILAVTDSFNLLLWAILLVGIVGHEGKTRLFLLVLFDWIGIQAAAYLLLLIVHLSSWTPSEATESPWIGLFLMAFGVLGFLTLRKSDEAIRIASKLSNTVYRSSGAVIAGGILIGMSQSLTSAPFIGGVLMVSSQSNTFIPIALVYYSTIAIFPSLLILIGGTYLKRSPFSKKMNAKSVNLVSSTLLILVGAYLAINH